MSGRFQISFMIAASFVACGCAPSSAAITRIDEMEPDRIDKCVREIGQRELYQCLLGVVPEWQLNVAADQLVDGPLDPNPPLPESVIELLQALVDECQLGSTYLQSATDFGGSLLIENSNLPSEQIECLRSAERPGLQLSKVGY